MLTLQIDFERQSDLPRLHRDGTGELSPPHFSAFATPLFYYSSINIYLLRSYYVSGTGLGAEGTLESKAGRYPALIGLIF